MKSHSWIFRPRFRSSAFGWNGSRKAMGVLDEASREILEVAKQDPAVAAEGAILLAERIWPAFSRH